MVFDKDTRLYSFDKELTVILNKKITASNKKELSKICSLEFKEEDKRVVYKFKDITDYNLFLYIISNEIITDYINNIFKSRLKAEFPEDYKRILKNHKELSFENNYYEFCAKTKLMLFFKHNDTLNVNTFLKFNLPKINDEIENVINLEVMADGYFLTEDVEEPDEEEQEFISKISKRYNNLFNFLNGKSKLKNKEINDIHIYVDKKTIKLVNEKNIILNNDETGVKFSDVKQYYLENIEENAPDEDVLGFYLASLIALYQPERIIIYQLVPEAFEDTLCRDISVLKQVMEINAECYHSSDRRPRI